MTIDTGTLRILSDEIAVNGRTIARFDDYDGHNLLQALHEYIAPYEERARQLSDDLARVKRERDSLRTEVSLTYQGVTACTR
jgi:hypothetical protein